MILFINMPWSIITSSNSRINLGIEWFLVIHFIILIYYKLIFLHINIWILSIFIVNCFYYFPCMNLNILELLACQLFLITHFSFIKSILIFLTIILLSHIHYFLNTIMTFYIWIWYSWIFFYNGHLF